MKQVKYIPGDFAKVSGKVSIVTSSMKISNIYLYFCRTIDDPEGRLMGENCIVPVFIIREFLNKNNHLMNMVSLKEIPNGKTNN